ncbi:MFS transporter [Burkholderia glumae]|uniref:MFS transporter n=1 Tax=Burkholderia glumae TaxID=337 RepID=A0AAP9Y282_BURGL|nr:MFS transporter [Burkholderia glumae]ACR29240.1 major facilitator superfamily MFS_1 [Burkholderia glumae BGR1]AJY66049.1 sugar (and other) transporter family protein [Burkholderia glumae LMG 2196 = ATCC 33617]KHJ64372.1 MFS transporter [Burkholderia glumae]MCM2483034.1 MFS transporter [Burkholderia glumae]MCM2506350.1 MFS transporter [Burkholderia glumae]
MSATNLPSGNLAQGRGDRYRWIVLGVAALAQTTASITAQGIYTLIPSLQTAFHLSEGAGALSVSALNGGQVVTMLMLGWLIDRFGERYVVAFTMVTMGLSALAGAVVSPSYLVLLLFFVLVGTSYASVQPGGTRAIVRWFPPNERGMATGVRQAGLPLGTALAAMVLPLMAATYSWRAALMLQGAIGIAGGILFGLLHRDERNIPGAPPAAPPNLLKAVKLVAGYSALWPVMLAGAAMVTFQYTFATHAIPFIAARFHYSVVAAALLFSISQWLGIAGRVGLAWISDRFWPNRRVRSLGASMAICIAATIALLLLPVGTSNAVLTAIFCVLGLFGVGWYPLYLLQIAEMAPKTVVASTISFSMTLNMVAISVVPPLFGVVVDQASYGVAWSALSLLLLAGIVVLWRGASKAELARVNG